MPSKPPSVDGPQVEPSAAQKLTPEMQTAMTTSRPRSVQATRMDDEQLDDLLRRELHKSHDWILEAPVPLRLIEILRGKPGG